MRPFSNINNVIGHSYRAYYGFIPMRPVLYPCRLHLMVQGFRCMVL